MGSDRYIWDWDSTSREHMLPWQCLMTKMLLTLAGLGILIFSYFLFFVNAMKTIGYSNLLMSENINVTFECFSIKDALNNLGDYWPTPTNHKSERATFG